MPPIDYREYPPNWKELRATVLERAGNRCEGSPAYPECRAENHRLHPVTGSIVVLTIAHYPDATLSNCDLDNLHSWCQRCHNTTDQPQRQRNAARTRQQKKYGENALLFGEGEQ